MGQFSGGETSTYGALWRPSGKRSKRLGWRRRLLRRALAHAYGARVTAMCSTAKTDLIRSIGADDVIDYTRETPTLADRSLT
jgi:hypothetical protein